MAIGSGIGRTLAVVGALTAISVVLTLGLACALPLAAFATLCALALPPGASVSAMLAIWAANQVIGFTWMHYPTDARTIEWGLALGAIGLLALAAARPILAGGHGLLRLLAAFVAAFVAYEGAVYLACVVSGTGAASFTTAIVERISLINAASFGGLLALRDLVARTRFTKARTPPARQHALNTT